MTPRIPNSLPRSRAARTLGALCGLAIVTYAAAPARFAAAQAAPEKPAPGKAFEEKLPASVVTIKMVPVPGGKIKVLDPATKTEKEVEIKPFSMSATEIPWEAFDVFYLQKDLTEKQRADKVEARSRPSYTYIPPDRGWGHNGWPAIHMAYQTADAYAKWLSSKTGKKYRLPTEAEWQWAASAGKNEAAPLKGEEMDKVAWYWDNADDKTQPVGKKQPNAWGLHDLLGNTGEWCVGLDGKPVVCGGSFEDKAEEITPRTRKYFTPEWQRTDPQIPKSKWWLSDAPFVGIRLVCEE